MPIEPAKHECLVRCHPAFGWRAKSTTQSLGDDRHSRTPVSATKANSKFRLGRAQRVPPPKDVKLLEHQLPRQLWPAQTVTLLPRRFRPKRKLGAAPRNDTLDRSWSYNCKFGSIPVGHRANPTEALDQA